MRVTNEQVQKIRTTSYNFRDQVTGVTTVDIATDLLDARELIKEMREVLNATRKTYSNEILTLAKMRIDEVLEKTKDYAE